MATRKLPSCHVLGFEENEPKTEESGGGVLAVNTAVVNSNKNETQADKKEKATMGWFQNCCGVSPNTKASLENDVNDSSLSPSFLVLDGFEIISLGKVGANRQEVGSVFLDEAQERWQQRLESHISIGNVSYKYHNLMGDGHSELVEAAYDFARNVSKSKVAHTPSLASSPSVSQSLVCRPLKKSTSKDTNADEMLPESQASLLSLVKSHQFAKASNQLCDMIDEDQEKRGAEDLVVAMETKNRAVLHLLCGQKEQAMYFFHEYLLSKKQCFGEKSTELSDSLNELGIVMYARGDKNGALSMLHNALALYGDDFWYNDNTLVPSILNNLGCAHYQRGDPATGLSFLQKALVVQRMALSEASEKPESALYNHAITKLNIGHIHLANGNAKALPMLEDALLLLQSLLGDTNTTVDNVQENIRVCNALLRARCTSEQSEQET